MAEQDANDKTHGATNGKPLTLQAFADHKCLPVDFLERMGVVQLRDAIGFTYYDETGQDIAVKRRTAMNATDGSYWPKGQALSAYGRWRIGEVAKAGILHVMEGESDTLTCWYHELPAVGIPGANASKTLLKDHLVGVDKIYVHREPDRGGQQFVFGIRKQLDALGFVGKAFALDMPDGIKDVSDLHRKAPERCKDALHSCIQQAELIFERGDAWEPGLATDGAPWEPPIPLGEVPDVEPFPIEVFPLSLQAFALEGAQALNCPPDYFAVPMLAIAGGAIGNSRWLSITRSHEQSASLYCCVVGSKGTAKSPALHLVRIPLAKAQRGYVSAWERQKVGWEEADEGSRGPAPILRRCIVGDTTTESLSITLGENPRGLALVRDELAGMLAALNQYKQGGGHDRQWFLELWASDLSPRDRKSDKGPPVFLDRPLVSIIGGTQPDVVERFRGESHRGFPPPDDGFLERWLFAFPDELPAKGESWLEVSPEAAEAWETCVEKLLGLTGVCEGLDERPFFVRLDASGKQAWERFTLELAAEINSEDFEDLLRGAWAKMKGYGGRLALILHVLRYVCGEVESQDVDAESMARATKLIRYFQSHTRKTYAIMGRDRKAKSARRLLKWIGQERKSAFTRRDAFRAMRGQALKETGDVDPLLILLEKCGYIRPLARPVEPGPGRKPSPAFEVNPACLDHGHNGHNGQNCRPLNRDCVHSVHSVQGANEP